jgi:TetR/AcrR family transcriptional repressor of nem operon
MSRPRSFDDTTALDAATRHFWARGYGASTVRDLGGAMGLGAASFYNAFGDKRALFLRCLDHYAEGGMRARIRRVEAAHPPRAAFLAEIVELSLGDPRGCLLVNAALEVAPEDAEVAALVTARFADLEAFFRRAILAGQKHGTIAEGHSADDLARLLVAAVMGLRVMARARLGRAALEGAARQAMRALD